jgi:hypothetical protein
MLHPQSTTVTGERPIECPETTYEETLPSIRDRIEQGRVDDEQGHHPIALGGERPGGVVGEALVPSEPDDRGHDGFQPGSASDTLAIDHP